MRGVRDGLGKPTKILSILPSGFSVCSGCQPETGKLLAVTDSLGNVEPRYRFVAIEVGQRPRKAETRDDSHAPRG
jgi:hypothetical protein